MVEKDSVKISLYIPRPLYDKLVRAKESLGFSSLNELVRYALRNFIESTEEAEK